MAKYRGKSVEMEVLRDGKGEIFVVLVREKAPDGQGLMNSHFQYGNEKNKVV